MDTDRELLRRYTQDGDEAAFTAVVYRHTDLVYSAALRLVNGDAHLAHDVAQKVFCTLALKAGSLRERDNLLGWLHTTTRYAASVAVRSERRRRHHEQEAAMNAHHDAPAEQLDWTQLQPLLDEAVGSLRVEDREAVLLRYFQGKSHREVGAELGLSETLARKRVERALEKLRTLLSRRGVTASSALLATTITAHAVQAAPVGYAAGFGSASLAVAAEAGSVGLLWPAILFFMKTKTIIVTSIIILGAVLVGTWWWNNQSATNSTALPVAGSHAISTASARVEPVRLAAVPVVSTDSSSPPEILPPATRTSPTKTAPAARASASATGSALGSPDIRSNFNYVLRDVLQLVNAGDYASLVRNYLPAKGKPQIEDAATLEQSIQFRANDPEVQRMLQRLGQDLATVQNVPPIFSADGRTARLKASPNAEQALVFVQLNNAWVFSGYESTAPAIPTPANNIPPPKKNPSTTGGGYVP